MHFSRGFLPTVLLVTGLLAGCSTSGPGGPSRSSDSPTSNTNVGIRQDSAYTLIQSADSAAIHRAFRARSTIEFFRRSRTRQVDASSGDLIASYTYLSRHPGTTSARVDVLEADSSGTFDLGLLSPILRPSARPGALSNPIPHLLPDDPAYLSNRGPGLYSYEMLPDTAISGRSVAVARVVVSPGADDDQQIRAAKFYVDRSSRELVGLTLRRRQQALLFAEETQLEVFLQWLGSDGWFPDRTSYQTRVNIPFFPAKKLETEARYYRQLPGG